MVVIKKTTPWYIGGLHFECWQCGSCCSGPDEGVIWISKPEINMLAERLGLSTSEIRKKYLKSFGFRYSIKENPRSKDCVFLVSINGSRGCAIYDVRPMQCRNWPFWPGNLQSPDDWNAAAVKCPGINKGRLYSFDEIQKIKKQKRWWNDKNENQKQSRDSLSRHSPLGTTADNGAVFLKICDQVKQIYDWLDENIKPLNNKCDACGKCCNFESFEHKLFVTTPELLYFSRKNKILPMTGANCPYQKDNKCTVYQSRFAGCRIFFCKSDKDMQNRLSEESIEKFKSLCDKFNLPYRYIDLASAVNNPELARLIKL